MIEPTNLYFNRCLKSEQTNTIWEPVCSEWIDKTLDYKVVIKIDDVDIEFTIRDFTEFLDDYLSCNLVNFEGLFISEETAAAYLQNEIPKKFKFTFNFHDDETFHVERAISSFLLTFVQSYGIWWDQEGFEPFFETLKFPSVIEGELRYQFGSIQLCARNFELGPHLYTLSPIDGVKISLKTKQMCCVIKQYCSLCRDEFEKTKELIKQRHYEISKEAIDSPVSSNLLIQLVEAWGRGYTVDAASIHIARLQWFISFADLQNTLRLLLQFKSVKERTIFLLNCLTILDDHPDQIEELARAWPTGFEESLFMNAIAKNPKYAKHYLIIIKGIFFASYAENVEEMGRGFLFIKGLPYLRIDIGDKLCHPTKIAKDWIEKIKITEIYLESSLDILKPLLKKLGFEEMFPGHEYFKRLGIEFCRVCKEIAPPRRRTEHELEAKLQRYVKVHLPQKDLTISDKKEDESPEDMDQLQKLSPRIESKIQLLISKVKTADSPNQFIEVLSRTMTSLNDTSGCSSVYKKLLGEFASIGTEASAEALCYVLLKGIKHNKIVKEWRLKFALIALQKLTESSGFKKSSEVLTAVANQITEEDSWIDFKPYLENIYQKVLRNKNIEEIEEFEKLVQCLNVVNPQEKLLMRLGLLNSIESINRSEVILFRFRLLSNFVQQKIMTTEIMGLCIRALCEVPSHLFAHCKQEAISLAQLLLFKENLADYTYQQKKQLLQGLWLCSNPCLSTLAEGVMNKISTREEILVLFRDWHDERCLTENSKSWFFVNYKVVLEKEKPVQPATAVQFYVLFLCFREVKAIEIAAAIWKNYLELRPIHALAFLQSLERFVTSDLFEEGNLSKIFLDITFPVLDKVDRNDSAYLIKLYEMYIKILDKLILVRNKNKHYIAYSFPIIESLVKKCPKVEEIKGSLNLFLLRYGCSCFHMKYYSSLRNVADFGATLGEVHRGQFNQGIKQFLRNNSDAKILSNFVEPNFEKEVLSRVSDLNLAMDIYIYFYPKLLRDEIKALVTLAEFDCVKKYGSIVRLVISAWESKLYEKTNTEDEILATKAELAKDIKRLILKLAISGNQEDEKNLLGLLPIFVSYIDWASEKDLIIHLAQFLFLLPIKNRNYNVFTDFFNRLVLSISWGFFPDEEAIKNLYFKLICYPVIFAKLNEEIARRHKNCNPFTEGRVNDFIDNAIKEGTIVLLLHQFYVSGQFGKLSEDELKNLIAQLIVDLNHLTAKDRLFMIENPLPINQKMWGNALALTIPLFELLSETMPFNELHAERLRLVNVLRMQVIRSPEKLDLVERAIKNHKKIFYEKLAGEDEDSQSD